MPASTTAAAVPSDLAWRVLGLTNLYRLLVPPVLLAMQWFSAPGDLFRSSDPQLLRLGCVAYLLAAIALLLVRRVPRPSLRIIALVSTAVDTLAICLFLYTCSGVASGLGILLVLPVGAMALLAGSRDAFLIPAVAAFGMLVQQTLVFLQGDASRTDYSTAGVLGAVLFGVGLSMWPLAERLRQGEALVRRQELDLANLAQLSQYIVQHLRESILVVDAEDRIRLINESAAALLGDAQAYPGALLGECSPRLLYLLKSWFQPALAAMPPPSEDATLVSADGQRLVRPHFALLGSMRPAPVLVFLEDTSLIAEKAQQLKLAALGRLSASIAHEIRNPVGAMSHAGQLLAESASVSAEDRRLTEIITRNAERVSGIIDNVLQLSRRGQARVEQIDLRAWVQEFRQEFCETMQWPPERLALIDLPDLPALEVGADPGQLRQVVWNLCDNAIKHGLTRPDTDIIEIRYGRLPASRPFLEVADRGAGVPPEHAERIFEPFFSGSHKGTGLGLFLARELVQSTGAALLYEPRPQGGSIFRIVFADPRRWELG
ncbi:MAG TPA: ATP-binding protein [Steroidobacteraceae bacterium]|nr:ATP-binding protein [Steroidobacteraceae bacterium]